jgi:membrane protein involved in colicin uptake
MVNNMEINNAPNNPPNMMNINNNVINLARAEQNRIDARIRQLQKAAENAEQNRIDARIRQIRQLQKAAENAKKAENNAAKKAAENAKKAAKKAENNARQAAVDRSKAEAAAARAEARAEREGSSGSNAAKKAANNAARKAKEAANKANVNARNAAANAKKLAANAIVKNVENKLKVIKNGPGSKENKNKLGRSIYLKATKKVHPNSGGNQVSFQKLGNIYNKFKNFTETSIPWVPNNT